ncbi:MAG: Na/Pi cotransporter family protein [candidate division Zixibacteria bacterium]|nr:Na/Pi cotransporter family protein [candidate division Zixibacteria bacterium]
MTKELVFSLVGGLGMFLFGMQLMSNGLKATSSDKVKRILTLLTKNRVLAVLLGAGVTALIQSSSGMTVITVGLVNSGLLSLTQAIGVVMGANIGTTLTAWLVSFIGVFKITDYSLILVGLGFFMTLAPRGKGYRIKGQILIGLGLLFLGLDFMKDAFLPLRESQAVLEAFQTLSDNPIIGVLVGAVITMLLQSSSATIAIVQLLAYQGLIDFSAAVPLVLGDNIGTTITAQIAAFNTNINGRRTAMAHTLFNVIGTAYILPLLSFGIYQKFIQMIAPGEMTSTSVMMYIALAHSAFNIVNTVVLLPFTGLLEKGALLLTPIRGGEEIDGIPRFLDNRLLNSPAAALIQARREVLRMAGMAREALEASFSAFINKDAKNLKKLGDIEDAIDNLQTEITNYLIKISQQNLEKDQSRELPVWIHSVNDLERIGDHTENLVELTERAIRSKTKIQADAKKELVTIFQLLIEMSDHIHLAIDGGDHEKAYKALACEDKINSLYIEFRDSQVQRMNSRASSAIDSIIFIDVLNNLEKIGDHLTNIAQAVLNEFRFQRTESHTIK